MSLFRRRTAAATTARAALKNPTFACTTPGVSAVHVDYDPAVWVRPPVVGQDRTDWVEAHLSAYATDLGLSASDELYGKARVALDLVADSDLSHTCDLVSLQGDGAETGMVAYVDVLDEELGLLEHGDPEAFVTMADLVEPGGKLQRPDYFPTRRQPRSWRTSSAPSLDPETMVSTWLQRAYRRIDADGTRPAVHLYAFGVHVQPRSVGPLLQLFTRVDVQLSSDD